MCAILWIEPLFYWARELQYLAKGQTSLDLFRIACTPLQVMLQQNPISSHTGEKRDLWFSPSQHKKPVVTLDPF